MTHRVVPLAGVLSLLLALPALAGDPVDEYEWKISDEEVNSGQTATVVVSLDVTGTGVAAYTLAICPEDDLVLVEDSVTNGEEVENLSLVFHSVGERKAGFIVTALLQVDALIDVGDDYEMYLADYTGPSVGDGEDPITLALDHCVIGVSPPVQSTVVIIVEKLLIELTPEDDELTATNGSVTFAAPPPAPPFIRGDCNNDGRNDIADGIFALNALFNNGTPPSCIEACNSDDSSEGEAGFDSTDAILIFNYQFLEGPPPVAPFPGCGIDEAELEDTNCDASACD